jgi:hypothetical protein
MKLSVELPKEAVDAIEARQDWTGSAKVVLSPEGGLFEPDTLRIAFPAVKRASIVARSAKAAATDAYAPSRTERLILEAWNDSEFIRDYAANESRNNPVPTREVSKMLPLLRRVVKEVGPEKVLDLMSKYFDCCLRREHIWDDRNHGYAHLGGFLRAVLNYVRDKKPAYWMEKKETAPMKDANTAVTVLLADAYAKRFLGRREFGLANPSQDYARFSAASARVAEFKRRNPAWEEARIIGSLLDAVAGAWGLGGSPPPGSMASDRTWKVVFPAYLKSLSG